MKVAALQILLAATPLGASKELQWKGEEKSSSFTRKKTFFGGCRTSRGDFSLNGEGELSLQSMY